MNSVRFLLLWLGKNLKKNPGGDLQICRCEAFSLLLWEKPSKKHQRYKAFSLLLWEKPFEKHQGTITCLSQGFLTFQMQKALEKH